MAILRWYKTLIMVLASDVYLKEDYIRDYDEFIKFRNEE